MSYLNLLDHTVTILRPQPSALDSSLGDERDEYAAAYTGAKAAFWPLHTPLTDFGAGETPEGDTLCWLEASVVPQERDVIVVTAGPETPKRWRVTATRSPGRRFGTAAHHREVECEALDTDIQLVGYDVPLPSVMS